MKRSRALAMQAESAEAQAQSVAEHTAILARIEEKVDRILMIVDGELSKDAKKVQAKSKLQAKPDPEPDIQAAE